MPVMTLPNMKLSNYFPSNNFDLFGPVEPYDHTTQHLVCMSDVWPSLRKPRCSDVTFSNKLSHSAYQINLSYH